jgi:hypothetical protein
MKIALGNANRARCLLWLAVVVVLASSGAGQTKPDFSGRWVLADPVAAPAQFPRTLLVQQPVYRTNDLGEPTFLDIVIERRFVGETRTDTYRIGVQGGVVSVVSPGGTTNRPPAQTRFFVRWEADRLVIETGSYSGSRREDGPYSERVETWELERSDRLCITFDDRGSAIASTSVTATYDKE